MKVGWQQIRYHELAGYSFVSVVSLEMSLINFMISLVSSCCAYIEPLHPDDELSFFSSSISIIQEKSLDLRYKNQLSR